GRFAGFGWKGSRSRHGRMSGRAGPTGLAASNENRTSDELGRENRGDGGMSADWIWHCAASPGKAGRGGDSREAGESSIGCGERCAKSGVVRRFASHRRGARGENRQLERRNEVSRARASDEIGKRGREAVQADDGRTWAAGWLGREDSRIAGWAELWRFCGNDP